MVSILSFLILLSFQAFGVSGADSGDLVTAAYLFGVPHPPGYPLYTALGWFLTRLPLFSVAWRVGLLSSVPHAFSVGLVYLTVRKITGKQSVSLIASTVLLGNYLFFFYGVTAEVFALLDFFTLALIYCAVSWFIGNEPKYLMRFALLSGLSLTHHQVIIFQLPAYLFLGWLLRKRLSREFRHIPKMLFLFSCGLLPYIYIPLAARHNAVINWENASTVRGFIDLVTRARYGTFQAATLFGTTLTERLLGIKAYFQFMLTDFYWIGMTLVVIGFVWLARHQKVLFWFILTAFLFTGPLYYFYASYPILTSFSLGIYERFLLPSYVIVSIVLGCGITGILESLGSISRTALARKYRTLITAAVYVFGFSFGILMLVSTALKFTGLPEDRTTAYLGIDLLRTVEPDGLLLLLGDSPLFMAQYQRYVEKIRPDVIVLYEANLRSAPYLETVKKNFPGLALPEPDGKNLLTDFIDRNRKAHPVYSNVDYEKPSGTEWIPRGLLYKLYDEADLPTYNEIMSEDRLIWAGYHLDEIKSGILLRYKHFVLTDVLNPYAVSRLQLGKLMKDHGFLADAEGYYTDGLSVGSDQYVSEIYTQLGIVRLALRKCPQAEEAFFKSKETAYYDNPKVYYFLSVVYGNCFSDQEKADEYLKLYEQKKSKVQTPLENL
ncbi:hypothetical protein A2Z33_01175 [Candidatus Gottesmanbacteria bacterium RBG_16_52_11]|uniref:DUF2723 domain-containing protein n=1 Tax=Candidatus Gottesmanbacteria bacterium RBG_16_52_11 TaxID=1798374 RepID=A0A1F5YNZ3_9BACT|nr:MAG: hypothetical protein A2Z33_01175 [Candidatus Gottesmanbacteria bacterium RBG_16_52_11]